MSPTGKRLAIAALIIIIAFIPSLFAELCSIDDLATYKWLAAAEPNLKDLFFPHVSKGTYYRPLIGVSYLFDKYVWLLDTRLMHLDNLLFHLVNALLVYYLAFLLLPVDKRQRSTIPLVASLLFGIHPVATESVAWISGRTDIMAGTFVLVSAVCLVRFRESRKYSHLLLAFLALLPGLLVKETPLAFSLGALFILSAKVEDPFVFEPDDKPSGREPLRCAAFAGAAMVLLIVTYSVWPVFFCGLAYLGYELFRDRQGGMSIKAATLLKFACGASLPLALFFLVRKAVFTSSIGSIGRTLQLIAADLNYACQSFFGAAGFYMRKFLFPFPLNFAIREIDPIYNVAGIAGFFLCLYAMRRRSMNSALFLSGVCLFLPALPLSLGTVTWTAYAERYIYMSTAFWALAVSLWGGRFCILRGHNCSITAGATVLLLLIMGVCTLQRSMTWRTNLGLICDTVNKSPGFKMIRNDYMAALMASDDLDGAKAQYAAAQKIPSVDYIEALDLNMAAIYAMEGKSVEADKLYQQVLKKTQGKSSVAYGAYISYLQDRYAAARKKKDGSHTGPGEMLMKNMEKLHHLTGDPHLLYRSGQIALALDKCDEALRLFTLSGKKFPVQSDYARFSRRLAAQLASGRCLQGHS